MNIGLRRVSNRALFFAVVSCVACSGGAGGREGSGGQGSGGSGTGGGPPAGSTGGNTIGTGGASPSGTGGAVVSTGGRPGAGTGGAPVGTGGMGTGGSMAATGGRGGRAGGGASGGRGGGTGGTVAGTGGAAGATGGVSGGTGGTSGGAGAVGTKPSAGCGMSSFPASGKYMIDVSGVQRAYIIKLPSGYDNTKPLRMVMTWHGLGGSAERTANAGYEGSYYGLEPLAGGQAIFLSGQGLSASMGTGWPNTNGQDVAYVRALWEYLRKVYCIDESRVFSVGKSYGGLFSNVLGCAMGDVFRAVAPQSGWWQASGTCVGQVAYWGDHGTTDTTIDPSRGRAARDVFLKANHCGATTKPWNQPETTCLEYDGCDAGKTVIWCEFDGGHVMPSWASAGVWKFLMQF